MKNSLINRIATMQVAEALGELNKQVIYVGGAVVSLYIDDPAADDVRPTKDIDISFEILNLGQLERIRQSLCECGFKQTHEDKVLCRFRLNDTIVDVMSTKEIGWAPANRWFKPGYDRSYTFDLDGLPIRLMPLSYFIAAKFDAFHDRGSADPRTSHDFEDIVYLINHTSDLISQIIHSPKPVRKYLVISFKSIIESDLLQEAVIGNLYHEQREERFEMIMTKLKKLVDA